MDLIHSTIHSILKVSPLSGEMCLNCFKQSYPYITKETYLHKHAMENLLRTFSYAPVLRERGLTTLVEKLIEIDVGNADRYNNMIFKKNWNILGNDEIG